MSRDFDHPHAIPRFISAEQTLDLRSRILRPGQPLENCRYIQDNLDSTFHLGILDQSKKIISNGTFILEATDKLPGYQRVYRLRGMASDHHAQRQGLGRRIIEVALTELQKRQSELLWFNARTSAEGFYKKLGFDVIEEVFDIPLVGPHKVMYKVLK